MVWGRPWVSASLTSSQGRRCCWSADHTWTWEGLSWVRTCSRVAAFWTTSEEGTQRNIREWCQHRTDTEFCRNQSCVSFSPPSRGASRVLISVHAALGPGRCCSGRRRCVGWERMTSSLGGRWSKWNVQKDGKDLNIRCVGPGAAWLGCPGEGHVSLSGRGPLQPCRLGACPAWETTRRPSWRAAC